MSPLTNDTAQLAPKTSFDGRRLEFDFPGLEIGVAQYEEGPTGCTVFHFPKGAVTAIDVRGGAVGSTMTNAEFTFVSAICFAGGSLYGLEAATGVAAELYAARGYDTQFLNIASASVGKGFDFTLGELAGQGAAFRQSGPTKVAVFTVVNACGAIIDRQGNVARGHLDRRTNERRHVVDHLEGRLAQGAPAAAAPGNTTLTLVVTNQRTSQFALQQMARQVHSSMARCIQPFHTISDGDILYAATTNEIANPSLDDAALAVLASELAWDAVLASFDPET